MAVTHWQRGVNMGLNLSSKSYEFDNKTIEDELVDNKIGNYALGYVKENTFYVRYVGRADTCLKERLKDHEHMADDKCKRFKFAYTDSVENAFQKECANFHEYSPALNKIHPDSPNGLDLECPIEDCDNDE